MHRLSYISISLCDVVKINCFKLRSKRNNFNVVRFCFNGLKCEITVKGPLTPVAEMVACTVNHVIIFTSQFLTILVWSQEESNSAMQTRVPAWLKALLLATCIRLLHVGVLYVSSHTLQDYDTSAPLGARACVAHAVNATPPIAPPGQTLDHSNLTQQSWTWRLVVWDSVFYTDIACNGYRYEQQYAFFPLLPGESVRRQCSTKNLTSRFSAAITTMTHAVSTAGICLCSGN